MEFWKFTTNNTLVHYISKLKRFGIDEVLEKFQGSQDSSKTHNFEDNMVTISKSAQHAKGMFTECNAHHLYITDI